MRTVLIPRRSRAKNPKMMVCFSLAGISTSHLRGFALSQLRGALGENAAATHSGAVPADIMSRVFGSPTEKKGLAVCSQILPRAKSDLGEVADGEPPAQARFIIHWPKRNRRPRRLNGTLKDAGGRSRRAVHGADHP
jgi:hypothetical protein